MAWRLFTRNGVGWSGRFGALMPDRRRGDRSCGDGLASFDLIRHHRANHVVFLYAFDLIELNGNDLRRDSLEGRKATLEMILAKSGPGIRFNEHCGRRRRDRVSPRLQAGPRRHCLEAQGLGLQPGALARLAQNEKLGCSGREARSGGRMRQQETMVTGKNRIMIYGPKTDGRYVVKFRTAASRWRSRCRAERPACSSTSRERRAAPMAQMTNWSARRLLRDIAS
jgi:hypothetical protein